MKGRVLIVAGSDSGGGAGIQADIKTVTALGGFAMTAVTAITAQNTCGVSRIDYVSPEMVAEQMTMVLDDLGADIIKLGMLGEAAIMLAVAEVLARYPAIPCVIDPVMVATSGARLMTAEGETALSRLYGRCLMLTPNLPELEVLSGRKLSTEREMAEAARDLSEKYGIRWVLAKGGHLSGRNVTDILIGSGTSRSYTDTRLETLHTHGTGCTLSSAIATYLAQGYDVEQAVEHARFYVRQAILQAPVFGKGTARPMNHLPKSG
ncbi:bifunctional hydroxymethylpyrimidine kinase/phosphomethylpyrimidine kinase [Asaia bogorensis]|uniref:bifunctional hydroxymethylpyrimidine kinase/phosphomethylpyrimidine kinase n=1 Tax=Asaia bogorensis TaxID=91915 RepID=UPI000EFADE83|nr:bifunctional hydroxymethylpyrimidine kinase/phosphomethylpyrimidine kinase [Asaia bogorensis]